MQPAVCALEEEAATEILARLRQAHAEVKVRERTGLEQIDARVDRQDALAQRPVDQCGRRRGSDPRGHQCEWLIRRRFERATER